MTESEITIRLHFTGGPLDGCTREQQIPPDWSLIRYEHRPQVSSDRRHVYRGQRQPEQSEVTLRYVGPSSGSTEIFQ